jgi:hypothetical protein
MRHYEHVIKFVLDLDDALREDARSIAPPLLGRIAPPLLGRIAPPLLGRIAPPLLEGPLEDYPSFIHRYSSMYDAMRPAEAAMMVGALKSIYIGCMFVRGGRKVFQLSQPLAVALSQTELSRVPCELVKLPFDSLYVEFPRDSILLTISSSDDSGNTYRCEGVYCVRNGDRLDLMLAGMGKGKDDQTAYTTLHLEDGKDLTEILEASLQATDPDLDDIVDRFGDILGDPFGRKVAREVLRRASTLVFNVLLYISSPDADIAPPRQGGRHPQVGGAPG